MLQRFFIILGLGLCLSGLAVGQSSTGTIQGSVTDVQGAVIPNAPVTITNDGNNRSIAVTSSGEGLFSQPALDPGLYTIEIKVPNFATTTQHVTLR